MRDLHNNYSAEIDAVDERTWCDLLQRFDDANIYQAWQYGIVRSGARNLSHLVLKKNGKIVGLAQARLATLGFLDVGIAYVRWGPMWQSAGELPDRETFRQALRALRNEYACRRGLLLRLYPRVFNDDSPEILSILNDEGFESSVKEKQERTILMDLRPSRVALGEGLKPHWRRELKTAAKQGLTVVDASDDEGFETFIGVYKEMVLRKKFVEPNDIYQFRAIQRALPDSLKMRVLLCRSGEDVCAGLVCSAIGNSAVYLFGATSNLGMKKSGSYLLHWQLIDWLKEHHLSTYDLNGVNPVVNPGLHKFKSELAGSNGRDVNFMGRFDASDSLFSASLVRCGEAVKSAYGTLRTYAASPGLF